MRKRDVWMAIATSFRSGANPLAYLIMPVPTGRNIGKREERAARHANYHGPPVHDVAAASPVPNAAYNPFKDSAYRHGVQAHIGRLFMENPEQIGPSNNHFELDKYLAQNRVPRASRDWAVKEFQANPNRFYEECTRLAESPLVVR